MEADLMFILEKASTGEMSMNAAGVTWHYHPNLEVAVVAAERDGLIAIDVPEVPHRPHCWHLTDAGRERLDGLWKANGRRGFDAPEFVVGDCCGKRHTFPGDTVECPFCTEASW